MATQLKQDHIMAHGFAQTSLAHLYEHHMNTNQIK